MELIFNELSAAPLDFDKYKANNLMIQFAETVNAATQKGFRNVRSHFYLHEIKLAENYSVHDWLTNKDVSKDHKDYLFGKFVYPFIKENDEAIEEQYVTANYYFESTDDNIEKIPCVGLASAYLYETLSISLPVSPIWNKLILPIIIEKDNRTLTEEVLNISLKTSFEIQVISDFVENIGIVILNETSLLPNEKKIHLADHHGKAELQILCDQLKQSPYVIEMYSTDWGGKSFIRKVHKNGVVEIVLFKTPRHYALWVQTTGRNYRETKAIAGILEEKYS